MSASITDDCPICEIYAMSREHLIRREIAKTSSGAEIDRRWRNFLRGVHWRHMPPEERLLLAIFGLRDEDRDESPVDEDLSR